MSNWIHEHGKEYEVPESQLRAIGLVDKSWHNEMCPHFGFPEDEDGLLMFWCDHPDTTKREIEGKRYLVAFHPMGYGTPSKSDWDFESDNLDEAVAKAIEWRKFILPAQAKLRAKPVKADIQPGQRFIWNMGSAKETYPDLPEQEPHETVLWDRQEGKAVCSLYYGQLFCLEKGTAPLSQLQEWINGLTNEALMSEDIPGTNYNVKAVFDLFTRAKEAAKTEDKTGEPSEIQDQAFLAAKAIGWDWEEVNQGKFATWALKATGEEICEEARRLFALWAIEKGYLLWK